jgi:beta-lactamase class C
MKSSNATFGDFEQKVDRAWPHKPCKKNNFSPYKNYSTYYQNLVPSAGGLSSSLNDMVEFLKAQIQGKDGVVSKPTLEEFHTPIVEDPNYGNWIGGSIKMKSLYGLGWRILEFKGTRIVFHGGWVRGFQNILAFNPETGVGIAILNNSEGNLAFREMLNFFISLQDK